MNVYSYCSAIPGIKKFHDVQLNPCWARGRCSWCWDQATPPRSHSTTHSLPNLRVYNTMSSSSSSSSSSHPAPAAGLAKHWDGVFGPAAANACQVGFYEPAPESSLRLLKESQVLQAQAAALRTAVDDSASTGPRTGAGSGAGAGSQTRADGAGPLVVLDAGGGASHFVDAIVQEATKVGLTPSASHLRVVVADISAEAVAGNKARFEATATGAAAAGAVEWIVGDLTSPTLALPKRVDFWHDRAVMHFLVDPEQAAAYAARVRGAVPAGGFVAISAFDLDNDGRTSCAGLPVQRHSPKTLSVLLGPEFKLVHSFSSIHHTPGPRGITQPYMHALFQRGSPKK